MISKRIVDIVLSSIQQNFQSEGRPVLWQPSQRVLKSGGKTLDKTGRLKNSFQFRIGDDYVEIYTNTPYSPYNQYGTKFFPARPFLMVQDNDIEKIKNLMVEEILSVWKSMK